MKRYVPIIIGVVALCAVLYIGSSKMNKDKEITNEEQKSDVSLKSFQGKVTRVYEGDNTLEYGLDLPETATATVLQDGALVNVVDSGVPLLEMYLSYEGGRGYTPSDYITNKIVPKVKAITEVGTTAIGSHEWTVVESEWSIWRVAKSENGQWLVVVESRKSNDENVQSVIESLVTSSPSVKTVEATESTDTVEKMEVTDTTKEASTK